MGQNRIPGSLTLPRWLKYALPVISLVAVFFLSGYLINSFFELGIIEESEKNPEFLSFTAIVATLMVAINLYNLTLLQGAESRFEEYDRNKTCLRQ